MSAPAPALTIKLLPAELAWNRALARLLEIGVPLDLLDEVRHAGEQWLRDMARPTDEVNVEEYDGGGGLSWKEIERAVIARAIVREGSVLAAARVLHVGKTTLFRKVREYGIPAVSRRKPVRAND